MNRSLLIKGVAFLSASLLIVLLVALPVTANAQSITKDQPQSLVPTDHDLPDYSRIVRAGEAVLPAIGEWPEEKRPDVIYLNVDLSKDDPARTGTGSSIRRRLHSKDQLVDLTIDVYLYSSAEAAHMALANVVRGSSGVWESGTFGNADGIGDDSRVLGRRANSNYNHMMYRFGNAFVKVSGSRLDKTDRLAIRTAFPEATVETVAHQILIRLARQPGLTGVPTQPVSITINGKPFSNDSTVSIRSEVYVSAAAFAAAAGLRSKWDAEKGVLTIHRPLQAVLTLTTRCDTAIEGKNTIVPLHSPVVLESGQPMVLLKDLLPLLRGKVIHEDKSGINVNI